MKRIIVDYKKLTNEILKMISERYPDGYNDKDIIVFRNKDNEIFEAIEVKTEDTIYLVKVGKKLSDSLEDYLNSEDEEIIVEENVKVIDDVDLSIDEIDGDEDDISDAAADNDDNFDDEYDKEDDFDDEDDEEEDDDEEEEK